MPSVPAASQALVTDGRRAPWWPLTLRLPALPFTPTQAVLPLQMWLALHETILDGTYI